MFSDQTTLRNSVKFNTYGYCHIRTITLYKNHNHIVITLLGEAVQIKYFSTSVTIKTIGSDYEINLNVAHTQQLQQQSEWCRIYCYLVQEWNNLSNVNFGKVAFQKNFINKSHDGFLAEYEIKEIQNTNPKLHKLNIII